MILVVFALKEEAQDFVRWLEKNPRQVRVEMIGVGAESVEQRLLELLEKWQPERLILAGFAGALTNELQLGCVFCASNFSTSPSDLPQAILHSSSSVIETAAERAALAEKTGASCVDMESATVSRIAVGIPLLVLRAITDTPDAPIPIPFSVSYDLAKQKIQSSSILFWLMTRPARWPAFIRFLRDVRCARRALTDALIGSLNRLQLD